MKEQKAAIGVIGGSGLYDLAGLEGVEEVEIETPFGRPSDRIVLGRLRGHTLAFLPRHGRGHRLLPTEVPSRANIAALKHLGVDRIVAFSAVGSLKEELRPLDFVLPTQIIDRTRQRPSTFFGDGVVGHVAFADPFSLPLADTIYETGRDLGLTIHRGETVVCMEGPAFSTRAESHLYRSWGAGLINMSALPEAKLAREAEIAYALVCMVTDYDCWREVEEHVDVQMVVEYLAKNAENARRLLDASVEAVAALPPDPSCAEAARHAVLTDPSCIPEAALARLRYLFPGRF